MLMITGAETRKEVTDYIRSLRQCTYHVKKGHEDVNCPLEESEWPDGWMAANWGPPRMLREFRCHQDDKQDEEMKAVALKSKMRQ